MIWSYEQYSVFAHLLFTAWLNDGHEASIFDDLQLNSDQLSEIPSMAGESDQTA